jgi:hypothetical protein
VRPNALRFKTESDLIGPGGVSAFGVDPGSRRQDCPFAQTPQDKRAERESGCKLQRSA